jgi:hypothetical protein
MTAILLVIALVALALVIALVDRNKAPPPWRIERATLRSDLEHHRVEWDVGAGALTLVPLVVDPTAAADVEWSARLMTPNGVAVELYQETTRIAPVIFAWRSAVHEAGRMSLYRVARPLVYELRRMTEARRGLHGLDPSTVPAPVSGAVDVFLDEPGLGELIFGTELVTTLAVLGTSEAEVVFNYEGGNAYLHLHVPSDEQRPFGAPVTFTASDAIMAVLPLIDRVEDALRAHAEGPTEALTVEVEGREVALWTPRAARGQGRN